MFALFNDPLKNPGEAPMANSGFVKFVPTDSGFTAFETWDHKFVSQVPGQYGKFENVAAINVYEQFGGGIGVGLKTTWTRPNVDPVFSYFCCELPNS
jgi:hypothetical protein